MMTKHVYNTMPKSLTGQEYKLTFLRESILSSYYYFQMLLRRLKIVLRFYDDKVSMHIHI